MKLDLLINKLFRESAPRTISLDHVSVEALILLHTPWRSQEEAFGGAFCDGVTESEHRRGDYKATVRSLGALFHIAPCGKYHI